MYTHSQLVQICFPKLPYQQTFTEKKKQQIAVRFFSNYTTMTHNRTMTTNPQLRRSLSRFVCQQKQHLSIHSRKKIKPADGEGKKDSNNMQTTTNILLCVSCPEKKTSIGRECGLVRMPKNMHASSKDEERDIRPHICEKCVFV